LPASRSETTRPVQAEWPNKTQPPDRLSLQRPDPDPVRAFTGNPAPHGAQADRGSPYSAHTVLAHALFVKVVPVYVIHDNGRKALHGELSYCLGTEVLVRHEL